MERLEDHPELLRLAPRTRSTTSSRPAGLIYDINKTYTAYASYTEIFQPQNARDTSGSILPPIDGKSYESA